MVVEAAPGRVHYTGRRNSGLKTNSHYPIRKVVNGVQLKWESNPIQIKPHYWRLYKDYEKEYILMKQTEQGGAAFGRAPLLCQ